jgi:FkbM family methyltransferase
MSNFLKKVARKLVVGDLENQIERLQVESRQFQDQASHAAEDQRQSAAALQQYLTEQLGQQQAQQSDHARALQQSIAALQQYLTEQLGQQQAQQSDHTHALQQSVAALQQKLTEQLGQQQAQQSDHALQEQLAILRQEIGDLTAALPRRRIVAGAGPAVEYARQNPETGLMAFLYSFLPDRTALDVGANVGDVSERLLEAGYEVFAFEPFPPTLEKLQARLQERPGFHAFGCAIGAADSTLPLHVATDRSGGIYGNPTAYNSLLDRPMPSDLVFTDSLPVPVRSLASLHQSGEIPAQVSLVKIDTEGFDLEVIRGMGEHRYPVVVVEFWDDEFLWARAGTRSPLGGFMDAMRPRGYPWSIVFYRVEGSTDVAFYCNGRRSVPKSWGNAFFFRDYELFRTAVDWCSTMVPEARFQA